MMKIKLKVLIYLFAGYLYQKKVKYIVFINYFAQRIESNRKIPDMKHEYIKNLSFEFNVAGATGSFISFKQVQQNIGLAIPEELTLDSLRKQTEVLPEIKQLFIQYERQQKRWVLSYLTILRHKCEQAIYQCQFDTLRKIVFLYVRLQEWLLEDSDFLISLPPNMLESLRQKIEKEIGWSEVLLNSIDLIEENKATSYIHTILKKLSISGYLRDKEYRINVLINIFRFNQNILVEHIADLARLLKLLLRSTSEEENLAKFNTVIVQVIDSTEKKIKELQQQEEKTLPVLTNLIQQTVRLQAMSILLSKKNLYEEQVRVQRAKFYRYLCFLNEQYTKEYMHKALNALNYTGILEFDWEDVIAFKADNFCGKVRSFQNLSYTTGSIEQTFKNYGEVTLYSNIFTVHPLDNLSIDSVTKIKSVTEIALVSNRVQVNVPKKYKFEWKLSSDLSQLRRNWLTLMDIFKQHVPAQAPLIKKTPPEGVEVTVRVTSISKNYSNTVLVEIVDSPYQGNGVLLVSDICRYSVETLEHTFYEGDRFKAIVKTVADGRINFSILYGTARMIKESVTIGNHIDAKLFNITDKNVWISENGYLVYTPLTHTPLELGMFGKLEIVSVNNDGSVKASYCSESTIRFDEVTALNNLIGTYIEPEDELDENEPEERKLLTTTPFTMDIVEELILILDKLAATESNVITRYNLLSMARLLAFIIGNTNYFGYYGLHIAYQESLYLFTVNEKIHPKDIHNNITEDTLKRFPALKKQKTILMLLQLYNQAGKNDQLIAFLETNETEAITNIARLILSNNLLHGSASNKTLKAIKDDIVLILQMNEIEQPTEARVPEQSVACKNFGREDGCTEFKTSAIFPAGQMNPDMAKQIMVIFRTIAGFLNASGGTLYIGVNDFGDVAGLQSDYQYLNGSSDLYERTLRHRIVASFGKDINALISIRFEIYDEKEICIVTIPRYEKFVYLDAQVYQRQGNETRLLEGSALRMQEERRVRIAAETMASVNDILGNINIKESNSLFANALAVGLAKKEKKGKALSKEVAKIQTSAVRENPVTNYKDATRYDIIAYWSILETGEYAVDSELPRYPNSMLTLAIKSEEQNDTLILCYDNGCVNRLQLKNLLSKKRKYIYKNGMHKEAKLIYAGIAKENDLLMVKTEKNTSSYTKLIHMKRIKINEDMSLKGSSVFSFDFGKVSRWEIVNEKESVGIEKLINNSNLHQGVPDMATGFDFEMKRINQLLGNL